MPGTHVALIRGINVGRAKRIAMADLRDLVTALGHPDVCTLLNSGNVVFTAGRERAERIASRIEQAMLERLAISARVMVLTRTDYATAVEENALRGLASDATRLLVVFCLDAKRLTSWRRSRGRPGLRKRSASAALRRTCGARRGSSEASSWRRSVARSATR